MAFYYLPIEEQLMTLNQLISQAENSLKKKPKGSLVIYKKGNRYQYYHQTDSSRTYISKPNKKLIQALAQKAYDEKFLKEARSLFKLVSHLHDAHAEQSASFLFLPLSQIYSHLPVSRKELVIPYVLPDDKYIEEWLSVSYEGLPFTEDDPVIITDRGERVRSKTEKIIADKLYALGIPYRYEYPVYIPGIGTVHIDFVILDIQERREIYLEHFGLMQDPDYCFKTCSKIDHYQNAGLIMGDNFLCSFEGGRYVFQSKSFETMLRQRLRL